ncbi:RNA polymerase sigma factor [Taibaiella soli]|uniref:RNA polymerase sigma factor 70 region 4 type 2 domain-containing protein n=1 Tax=Taibaiella soli TaxID=1649169 RepID=A0A2W2APD6_9BACT|nr:sigma-70 family RNA polymerase sigma factor [Taibaiella soli]PZF74250.1 hypothetical protein DN068_04345 [Taibaiella soli]
MTIVTRDQIEHYLLQGNYKDAIALLYKNYSAMLYGYILKFISDEYEAQQILVNLFTSLPSMLSKEVGQLNSVYCWLQQKARHFILTAPGLKEEDAISARRFEFLQNAAERDQVIFMRIYLQGRSRREVAYELGLTEETVAQSLYHSIKILRK